MARKAKNTRMCSGCMARREKSELASVCKNEKGFFFGFDSQSEKGRSVYICKNADCLEKSIKKKSFSRSFKCELPPEFYGDLREFFNSNLNSDNQE